jgi:uncharacterized membrane protein
VDQPLERLRSGGSRRPIALVVVVALVLLTLVWQPWSRAPAHGPAAVVATPTATLSALPSPSVLATQGQPVQAGTSTYVSLIDHEWTVVALLSPTSAGPAEEPALPHSTGVPGSGGPLLVLQQGLNYSTRPIERPGHPDVACAAKATPRLRFAVPLPADRVLYLGVTFPDINPAAKVSAVDLDWARQDFARVPSLVASLSGKPVDASYRLPSTGPGAVVLFALPRGTALPRGSYRFQIDAPGVGTRYLYACVGA